ncbi:MAG: CvpA family protein [Phycisphaerae bacterium]
MWMSLFSTILVLLIAFFQAVQGLFSGLIMCLLTILSAAAAFSLAEPLANWWMQWIHPDYALAGAFIVIFVLCLTITRTLADNFVPGNVRFTLWVDRAGGGLAGLVAGLIIVGMLCIGLQMLPFDAELMGFNRLQIGEDGRARRGSLWLNPDGFTVGLISTLANGSLAGAHRLEQLHPDWLMEIQWNRSGVQKESLHAVPAGSIDVEAAWDLRRPLMQRGGGGLVEPAGGYRFIVVRVSLSSRAADPDGRHRFTPTQWRLVGRLGRQWMQTPLRGISDAQEPSQLVGLRLDDAVVRSSSEAARLDLLFEVPESRDFQPVFVEYKRLARAAVRLQDKPLPGLKRKAARGGAPEVGPGKAPRRKARPAPRGRVSGRRARQTDSRFSDELPIALAPAELSSQNASIAAGRLQQGHIVVALDGRRADRRAGIPDRAVRRAAEHEAVATGCHAPFCQEHAGTGHAVCRQDRAAIPRGG